VDATEPSLLTRSGVRDVEVSPAGLRAYFAAFQILARGREEMYSLQCACFSRRMALWYEFFAVHMAVQLG
jgi:hypothetical protein